MSSYLKKSFKFLAIALVLNVALCFYAVKAYDAPDFVQIIRNDLKYNKYEAGDTFTKDTAGKNQRVYNKETITPLTVPCTDCKISVRLKSGSEIRKTVTTVMGDTKDFGATSSIKGDYYLEMARKDITLVSTSTYGTWYINS